MKHRMEYSNNHHGLTWYEKLISALGALWMFINKLVTDYMIHSGGFKQFFFMIMDCIILAAFGAIVTGFFAFVMRKFCDRFFPNLFKKKSET